MLSVLEKDPIQCFHQDHCDDPHRPYKEDEMSWFNLLPVQTIVNLEIGVQDHQPSHYLSQRAYSVQEIGQSVDSPQHRSLSPEAVESPLQSLCEQSHGDSHEG